MTNIIKVNMADLNTTHCPGVLTTLGLGSCVGIVLYDTKSKISGMAHVMLPTSSIAQPGTINEAKFADTAIDKLLKAMFALGANKSNMTAKIAGGSQMFASKNGSNDILKIGQKNVEQTISILKEMAIPLIANDTGGNFGRTIEFYSETGLLLIKTIGHGVKYI